MSRLARSLAAWFAIWRPMLAGPFVDHPEIGSDDDWMAVADAGQDGIDGCDFTLWRLECGWRA